MNIKKISGGICAAGLIAAGMSFAAPNASASPCGYWTTHDAKYYNNCSGGNQLVQVDYQVGNTQMCVAPGQINLYDGFLNPVTNAFAVKNSC